MYCYWLETTKVHNPFFGETNAQQNAQNSDYNT